MLVRVSAVRIVDGEGATEQAIIDNALVKMHLQLGSPHGVVYHGEIIETEEVTLNDDSDRSGN